MSESPILEAFRLGFPWHTFDPFLFCVHHLDDYPAGDERMAAPREQLVGRRIGNDFSGKDGWSMYHGQSVPGFPQHPHRGFETITIARQGYIDHTDSIGASARFGNGDVQWMTAGKGVVHSEMFPLVHTEKGNPTELFQIWLNLPAADKMVDPHFTMFWNDDVPVVTTGEEGEPQAQVRVVAGTFGDVTPPAPPPSSWGARPESNIMVWTIRMEPGSVLTLPASAERANRALYYFVGDEVTVAGSTLPDHCGLRLNARSEAEVVNTGTAVAELLLLQATPIGEPVANHGPFVMNTRAELQQAFIDYQRTQFGGWPWDQDAPVHPRTQGRFAKHADGRMEEPVEPAA